MCFNEIEVVKNINYAIIKALTQDGVDEEVAYTIRTRLLKEFGII
jgi:hypothetical protein